MERISVFIDGANFYHSIKNLGEKIGKIYQDFYFDFEKYIQEITKKGKLIDVYYFNAPLKQQLNPNLYTKQQLQLQRLRNAGFKVILCKRKLYLDEDGKESHKIKEDDIRLALQMQKDAYDKKFDTAYLISGDGDFVPLPEYLNERGKKVKVFYFENSGSASLLKSCKMNCEIIDKKIVNRFFCRGAYHEWLRIKNEREEAKKKLESLSKDKNKDSKTI